MGRTKSWLALVLAIVMVLGMAVPAMAAVPPIPVDGVDGTRNALTLHDASNADVTTVSLTVGDDPFTLKPLVDDSATSTPDLKALNKTVTGIEPVFSFVNDDTDLAVPASVATFAVEEGVIKMTPTGVADGYKVAVYAQLPADKEWSFTNLADDSYFVGSFTLNIKATIDYNKTPKAIFLDINDMDKVSALVVPADFTTNVSNAVIKIKSVTSTTPATARVIGGTDKYTVVGMVAGTTSLTVALTVNDVATDDVTVPVYVVAGVADTDYQIVTNKDATGIKVPLDSVVTDEAAQFKMQILANDGKTVRKPVTGTTIDALSGFTLTFKAADGKAYNASDSIVWEPSATPSTTQADLFALAEGTDYDTTGVVTVAPTNKIISAKGTLEISKGSLLLDIVPFEISPISLGIESTITLDKKITSVGGTPANAVKYLTPVYGNTKLAFTPHWATTIAGLPTHSAPGSITISQTGTQIKLDASSATVGKYDLYVVGTSTTKATEIKKVAIEVVDNTTPATFTPSASAVSLDKYTPKLTDTVSYSVTGGIGTGSMTAGLTGNATKGPSGATLSHVSYSISNDANKRITITANSAAVLGEYTIELNPTIDGLTMEDPATIKVTVDDKDPIKPHHFVVNPVEIKGSIKEVGKQVAISVVNYNGDAISGVTLAYTDYEIAIGGATAFSTTGKSGSSFNVNYLTPGNGKITISKYGSLSSSAIPNLEIPVAISGLSMTADKTAVTLDTKDSGLTAGSVEVTFTPEAGVTLASVAYTPTNGLDSYVDLATPVVKDGKVTQKFSIKSAAAKLKPTKFSFVGTTTDGKTTDPVNVIFTVNSTEALIVDKDSITFEMKPTGKRNDVVTLTSNPAGTASTSALKITKVTVADPTIVKCAETTGATTYVNAKYLLTAIANGKTTVTFEGGIYNGSTLTKALPSVTVDVTVTEEVKNEITLTLDRSEIDLATNKVANTAWSAPTGTTLTDAVLVAVTGGEFITIDSTAKTITAKAEGTATVKVTGKIDGVDAESNVATITVKATPTTTAGIYIAGKLYENGDTFFVPNNFKVNEYKVTRKTDDGTEITAVTLSRSIAKSAKVRKQRLNISGTCIVPTQVFGKTKLTVKATGLADLTIELNVARLPEVDNTKVPGITENPQAGTRGYFFDYETTNTPEAYYTQPKFWNFTTDKASVAKVKANGLIEFYKAGTVTLTATRKSNNKSLVTKFTLNLTVTDEYLNTGSWVAVLSNSTKKDAIAGVLSSQNYPKGTAGASYDYTKAGYDEMIAYLQANAKETDVSAVYIDGAITKNGFTLSGTTISLTDLAADLAKVPGKIFLTLNGAGSTLYSSKDADATPADIAKVFAAAEAGVQSKATALSTVGTNGFWSSQKFYVLSATQKKSQTSVSATKADAVADAFIKALTLTDGKFSNGDTRLTLKELYTKVKKDSGKVIGYYPSAVKGVAVGYNYVP